MARSASAVSCASWRLTKIPPTMKLITVIKRQYDHDGAFQALEFAAQFVGGVTVDRRPDEGAGGIGDQKVAPRHHIRAGENSGESAQHRYELRNKDDLAAMAQKQVLAEFDPGRRHAHIIAVAQQQPIAEFMADHVADHATAECRAGSRQNDGDDVEIVFGPRVNRRGEKRGFPR